MGPNVRRILIVNGKGGCGKTTIATNLAATYAHNNNKVALIDYDGQASSAQWCRERPSDLPDIHLVDAYQRAHMYQTQTYHNRLPCDIDRIVIDAPSSIHDNNLELLLKNTDILLIPILPSAIDYRAGTRFITELLTHRAFRRRPRPVAVIANRVPANGESHEKFTQFLSCVDVPHVASFSDSSLYTDAVEANMGIADLTLPSVGAKSVDTNASISKKTLAEIKKEVAAWCDLITWIDAQQCYAPVTVQSLRQRPKPAPRHNEVADSNSIQA